MQLYNHTHTWKHPKYVTTPTSYPVLSKFACYIPANSVT